MHHTNRSCCFPLVPFSVYRYGLIFLIYIWKLPFSVCLLQTENRHDKLINADPSIYIYVERIYIFASISNGKWKPRQFSLICLCSLTGQTEVCHLSVCWQKNKWKLSICKWTKLTKRTCLSMVTTYTGFRVFAIVGGHSLIKIIVATTDKKKYTWTVFDNLHWNERALLKRH
jgi:hypothetical protein